MQEGQEQQQQRLLAARAGRMRGRVARKQAREPQRAKLQEEVQHLLVLLQRKWHLQQQPPLQQLPQQLQRQARCLAVALCLRLPPQQALQATVAVAAVALSRERMLEGRSSLGSRMQLQLQRKEGSRLQREWLASQLLVKRAAAMLATVAAASLPLLLLLLLLLRPLSPPLLQHLLLLLLLLPQQRVPQEALLLPPGRELVQLQLQQQEAPPQQLALALGLQQQCQQQSLHLLLLPLLADVLLHPLLLLVRPQQQQLPDKRLQASSRSNRRRLQLPAWAISSRATL